MKRVTVKNENTHDAREEKRARTENDEDVVHAMMSRQEVTGRDKSRSQEEAQDVKVEDSNETTAVVKQEAFEDDMDQMDVQYIDDSSDEEETTTTTTHNGAHSKQPLVKQDPEENHHGNTQENKKSVVADQEDVVLHKSEGEDGDDDDDDNSHDDSDKSRQDSVGHDNQDIVANNPTEPAIKQDEYNQTEEENKNDTTNQQTNSHSTSSHDGDDTTHQHSLDIAEQEDVVLNESDDDSCDNNDGEKPDSVDDIHATERAIKQSHSDDDNHDTKNQKKAGGLLEGQSSSLLASDNDNDPTSIFLQDKNNTKDMLGFGEAEWVNQQILVMRSTNAFHLDLDIETFLHPYISKSQIIKKDQPILWRVRFGRIPQVKEGTEIFVDEDGNHLYLADPSAQQFQQGKIYQQPPPSRLRRRKKKAPPAAACTSNLVVHPFQHFPNKIMEYILCLAISNPVDFANIALTCSFFESFCQRRLLVAHTVAVTASRPSCQMAQQAKIIAQQAILASREDSHIVIPFTEGQWKGRGAAAAAAAAPKTKSSKQKKQQQPPPLRPNNLGVFTNTTTGYISKGRFKNGLENGPCEIHYPDQSHFLGNILRGKRHGYGIQQSDDGLRYQGQWKNDQKHGWGLSVGGAYSFSFGRFTNNIPKGIHVVVDQHFDVLPINMT